MTTTLRRLSTLALVGVVALGALAGFVREYSGDFHYHLVWGERTLTRGQLYRVDDLSHTFAGQELAPSAWLGDVVLALGFRAGGYLGDYLIRAVCLALMLLLLGREATGQGLGRAATAAMLLVLVAQSCLVFYLRPEIFAFTAFAALYFFLGAHQRTRQWGQVAGALLVLAIWANLHGSVILGVMLAGLYAGDLALGELRQRRWRAAAQAAALGPLGALATLANPNGVHALFAGRVVNPSYLAHTAEWAPLGWSRLPSLVLLAYGFVVVMVVLGWRRTSLYRLGAAAVLAVLALRHQRFVTFALVALVPLAARHAVEWMRLPRPALRRLGPVVLGLVASTALWVLVVDRRLFAEVGLGVDAASYPVAACNFVVAAPPRGQLINNYDFGSYLQFCQRAPVFIDQRAWSLYPEWFYRRYLEAGQPGKLDALVTEYHLGWAFVKYDPLAAAMSASAEWALAYFDDQALVFVLRRENPSVAGFRYLDPARLGQLVTISGEALDDARAELARQRQRAPAAHRTLVAEAALAVAAGDDAAYRAAEAQLATQPLSTDALMVAAAWADRHGQPERAQALRRAAGPQHQR